VLDVKAELPWYVAVSVLFPEVVRVREQLPDPPCSWPVQLSTPSVTVTVPAGVPDDEATVKLTEIDSPTFDGFGPWSAIVVVVLAGGGALTVCASVSVLPLKLALPS
jgi:hypothetical protein